MNLRTRTAALTLAVPLGLGLLAGCGDDGEPGDGPSTEPTSEPTSDPSATDTTGADPTAYLPTPESITLSEPGSELDLKEPAVAGWKPRQDVVGIVETKVNKIEVTTVARSLADYDLEGEEATATPYFVTAVTINRGATDLGGRQLPFYAVADDQSLVAPTGIEQSFEQCPASVLPAVFAPGDAATNCLIFLVPKGHTLEAVMFRPPDGIVPLTWSGEVVDLNKPDKDKDKGKGGKGKGKGGKGKGGR